jgi:hypothetical protein
MKGLLMKKISILILVMVSLVFGQDISNYILNAKNRFKSDIIAGTKNKCLRPGLLLNDYSEKAIGIG